MLFQGHSLRNIAAALPISVMSVSRIRQEMEEELPLARTGRPGMVTEADKRYFARLIATGDAETATRVSEIAREDLHLDVNRQTIARLLNILA